MCHGYDVVPPTQRRRGSARSTPERTRLQRSVEAELRTLEPALIEVLAPGARRGVKSIAASLVDTDWLSGAVRSLEPAGRCGLRLLTCTPLPGDTLDALALKVTEDRSSPATRQLLGAGLVWARSETRSFGVLEALRASLRSLAVEPLPPPPAEPTGSDEDFVELRFSFTVGAALAAVQSLAPRATRLGQVHKADARPLGDALAGVCGGRAEALDLVQELMRAGLIRIAGSTLEVVEDRVRDAASRLFLHRLDLVRDDRKLAAGLGVLLAADGWVRNSAVMEGIAVQALRERTGFDRLEESVEHAWQRLARCGGLLTVTHDGATWCRLGSAARRCLDGSAWERPASGPTLLVQTHLQVIAPMNTATPVLVQLARFCRFEDADQVARLRVDGPPMKAAASRGLKAAEALRFLEENATHGVPGTVARAVSDWSKVSGTASMLVGAVLLTDAPADLVLAIAGTRACAAIAQRVWLIPTADAQSLVEDLRASGWSVTTHNAPGPEPVNAWDVPEQPPTQRAERIREAALATVRANAPG